MKHLVRSVTWMAGIAALAACAETPAGGSAAWPDAEWIGDGKPQPATDEGFYEDDPAPQFRKTFRAARPVRAARLDIVGLGLYEAHLNGAPVGPAGLAPLWTPFGRRVLYDTHDVTAQVREGTNVLAVTLGNGWYNPLPLRMWGHINPRAALAVGRPCLAVRLEVRYEDGTSETVRSDTTWKVAEGPVLRNSLYLGEVYDARRETPGWLAAGFDDSAWRSAAHAAGPAGVLEPRGAPPVVVRDEWTAVRVTEPSPGVYVADLGRNFAGWARLRMTGGAAGDRVRIRYGELLYTNGTVNGMTAVCGQIKRPGVGGPGAPPLAEQCDVYVRRGGDETWQPRFTWHGFRYLQIEGLAQAPAADDLRALALASKLPAAGEFECSLPLFNDVHRMCRETFLSNVFGVQSDCPARERFGYGADMAVSAEAFILNFDMHAFYAKALQDFVDEAADGWFTETAPYVGIGDRGFSGRAGPIGWTVGVPVVMRDLHRYYGDREVIARHFDACARYVDLVKGQCPDLIVPRCIGDHEALEKAPAPLTATAHFHQWARLVSEFAAILGRTSEARKYGELADAIRAAFQARFVAGGKVGQGRQGEQVFGLYHGLVPAADRAAALEILRKNIADKGGALSTGIYGTEYLLELLSAEGTPDLAGAIAARREFPGWGYMLDRGATTLWENWKGSDNTYSQNHPMFGSVDAWFFKHVLGIAPADDAVGFDKAVLRPEPVAGVTWARGTYRSVKGPVSVAWRLENGRMKLTAELPPGMTARVWLPAERRWTEAGPGRHEW